MLSETRKLGSSNRHEIIVFCGLVCWEYSGPSLLWIHILKDPDDEVSGKRGPDSPEDSYAPMPLSSCISSIIQLANSAILAGT